ncbi:hypothetical protein QTP88_015579 [Uroleucon formosanum]
MDKRQKFSISDFFNKKKKNDQVNNEDPIAVNNSLCQPIEFTRDDDTSECWDSKQAKYFCEKYPWLYFKNNVRL